MDNVGIIHKHTKTDSVLRELEFLRISISGLFSFPNEHPGETFGQNCLWSLYYFCSQMSTLLKLLVKISPNLCNIFALKWAAWWNFWSKLSPIFVIFLISNEQRSETFDQNFLKSLSQMSSLAESALGQSFSGILLYFASHIELCNEYLHQPPFLLSLKILIFCL